MSSLVEFSIVKIIIVKNKAATNLAPENVNIVITRHSIDTMIPMYVMTSTPVVSGPGSVSLGSTSYKKLTWFLY